LDRLFLDANVIFSAAYKPTSPLLQLWKLKNVELITSTYALEEATRNLDVYCPDYSSRLVKLIKPLVILKEISRDLMLPRNINLPENDKPILIGAIQVKTTHLLTGNTKHFRSLLGRRIKGVLIMTPGEYLRSKKS